MPVYTHSRLCLILFLHLPFCSLSLFFLNISFFRCSGTVCNVYSCADCLIGDSSKKQFSVRVHLIIAAIHFALAFSIRPTGCQWVLEERSWQGGVCSGHRSTCLGAQVPSDRHLIYSLSQGEQLLNEGTAAKDTCCKHHRVCTEIAATAVFTCFDGFLKKHLILFASALTLIPANAQVFLLFPNLVACKYEQ